MLRAGRDRRRGERGEHWGSGSATVCAVRGYRCIIVLPETTSCDKRAVLRAFGAEVILARADVEPSEPEGYIGRAERLAKEIGAFNPDQFENRANPCLALHDDGTGDPRPVRGEARRFRRVRRLGGNARRDRALPPREGGRGSRSSALHPITPGCAGSHGGTLVEGIVEDVASCAGQGRRPTRSCAFTTGTPSP